MAINSGSEVEAVISGVLVIVDKVVYSRGGHPALERARRSMTILLETFEKDEKPSPEQIEELQISIDAMSAEIGDPKMIDRLWDVQDYITYRT